MALIQMTYLSMALLRTVEVQVILPVDKMNFAGGGQQDKKYKTQFPSHKAPFTSLKRRSADSLGDWPVLEI